MKINDTQRIGAFHSYKQSQDHRVNNTSGKRSKDEVQFSQEAMELLSGSNGVNEADRTKRVEQLKHEVSTGTYHVPDHLLAEKLLPFIN